MKAHILKNELLRLCRNPLTEIPHKIQNPYESPAKSKFPTTSLQIPTTSLRTYFNLKPQAIIPIQNFRL